MAIFLYIILTFSYFIILHNQRVIIANSIVKILAVLFVAFYGFIILNEKINLKLGLGILFGILSIYLLSNC